MGPVTEVTERYTDDHDVIVEEGFEGFRISDRTNTVLPGSVEAVVCVTPLKSVGVRL